MAAERIRKTHGISAAGSAMGTCRPRGKTPAGVGGRVFSANAATLASTCPSRVTLARWAAGGASRKTMNTESEGAICSGIFVRPSAASQTDALIRCPVAASQNSGCFPFTLNVQTISSDFCPRLATKYSSVPPMCR